MAKSASPIYCIAAFLMLASISFPDVIASSIEDDKNSTSEETPAETEQKGRNWLWEAVEEQRKLKEDQAASKASEIKKQTEDKDSLKGDYLPKDAKTDAASTLLDKKKDVYSSKNGLFSKWTTSGITGLPASKLDSQASIFDKKSAPNTGGWSASWGSSQPQQPVQSSGVPQNTYGLSSPISAPKSQNNSINEFSLQRKPDVIKAPQAQTMTQIYEQKLGQAFHSQQNPYKPPVVTPAPQKTQTTVKPTVGKGRVSDPNDYLNK